MLSFIITTCVKNIQHFEQLKRCIKSVKLYHHECNIYLLDDSDVDYHKMIKETLVSNNLYIFSNLQKKFGELNIFKFIIENNFISKNEKIIFIHDSCVVKKKFDNINEVNDIQFICHFTNHRVHWDTIIEEKNNYNIKNNIITHTDLLKHYIKNFYNGYQEFQEFALNYLDNKNNWCGCMGLMCIIKKSFLEKINNLIPFADKFLELDKFIEITKRRHRIVNESLFSLLCHYFIKDRNFEDSLGGLFFDGYNLNNLAYKPSGLDDLLLLGGNEYIEKISFGR